MVCITANSARRCLRWVIRYLSIGPQRRPMSAMLASSTGRRNTSVKSLCWGFKSQGLAGPLVDQTVGVLIGTTLPRTLRIAEVNIDFGRQREPAMIRKLLAAVPGQRLIELSR